MKIAIASHDGVRVTEHAGRCRRFYIFTRNSDGTLERECRMLEADETLHALVKNGRNPIGDCSVMIAGSVGARLEAALRSHGIATVISHSCNPEEAACTCLQEGLDEAES